MAEDESTVFLLECEKISKIFSENLSSSGNLKLSIKENLNKCHQEFKKLILNQNNLINKLKNELCSEVKASNGLHLEYLEKISQEISQLKESSFSKSFSDVVRSTTIAEIKRQQHVVVIKPNVNKGLKTCVDTQKALKSAVSPQQINIGVKRIKNISGGGLIVECRLGKECQVLIREVNNKTEDITADKPREKRPKLIIKGVSSDTNENELIEKIINNNESIKTFLSNMGSAALSQHISLKFKFRKKSRKGDDNYCIEVSPQMRKILLSSGSKLFVDWKSCKVEDYLPLIRCYNCNGFGHKKENCKQEFESCGHCGQRHATVNCFTDRNSSFCTNCDKFNKTRNPSTKRETNHSSYSHKCQSFIKMQEIIKSKINYD
jgi:hypothetical protein